MIQIKHTLFSYITIVLDKDTTIFDTEHITALVIIIFVVCQKQYASLTFLVKNNRFHYLFFSVQTKEYTHSKVTVLLDPDLFLCVGAIIQTAFRSTLSFTTFYVTKKATTLLLNTKQIHATPKSESSVLVQGIADEKAKVVHTGSITITKNAKQTITKQTSKHITLSACAFVYAKPILDVSQNAVQCSHGSAIGMLQDSLLFYLQSRGYTKKDAAYWMLTSMISTTNNDCNMLQKTVREVIREHKELV